jgi:hypothetical protein
MIKIIQIIVVAILVFLIVRLVRLILRYSARFKSQVDKMAKEKEKIEKEFENIEEAEFRDITTEDEKNVDNGKNG